jgi:alkylation response protein AidB-like acyl-CoA dehydrogenase
VFLTDARIPADHLVGQENQGWALAKHTLGNERFTLSSGGVLWGMGPTTAQVLRGLRQPLDPFIRDEAVFAHIESEIMRLLGLRIMSNAIAGKPPGSEVAVKKLLADRHGQRVMELARVVLGADGMLDGDPEQSWGFLFSRALTIGGGTTEVLHNIIGEQMLALPKEAAAR